MSAIRSACHKPDLVGLAKRSVPTHLSPHLKGRGHGAMRLCPAYGIAAGMWTGVLRCRLILRHCERSEINPESLRGKTLDCFRLRQRLRRTSRFARNDDVERVRASLRSRAPDAAQRPPGDAKHRPPGDAKHRPVQRCAAEPGPISPHRAVPPSGSRLCAATRYARCSLSGTRACQLVSLSPQLCDAVRLPIPWGCDFHLAVCLQL